MGWAKARELVKVARETDPSLEMICTNFLALLTLKTLDDSVN